MSNNQSKLWVVSPYYNPLNYASRRVNYYRFTEGLRQAGVNLLTVECIFPGQQFMLPQSGNVLQLRSSSVLFQKERLLRLAVELLSGEAEYVAFTDCDLLFTNPNWAADTIQLLQTFNAVQLFGRCIFLPQGRTTPEDGDKVSLGFGLVTGANPSVLSDHTQKHGITGGAWAFKRSTISRVPCYEYAIAGGGDDLMCHAMFGNIDSPCALGKMHGDENQIRHYQLWAQAFYAEVQGLVTATPGDVWHLWHGDRANRQYVDRHKVVSNLGYNPAVDVVANPGAPLEWSPTASPELRDWFTQYFHERKEDG